MMQTRQLLPLALYSLGGLAYAQGQQRPNVVFILADDLGYGDIGCYGQKLIKTPSIDSLARVGVRYTDFYAGTSVSAPSRASLMTGKHTGHTQVRGNDEIQPEGQSPVADIPTLGSLFARSGYRTGIFGKWGLGYPGSGAEPLDRGFERFYGYNCQRASHLYFPDHLWDNREIVTLPENAGDARKSYAPDLIQAEALKFIRTSASEGKPFFAMLTYTLPHAELNLPHDETYQYYRQHLSPKPWKSQWAGDYPATEDAHASFAAMVTRLDKYVGEVCQLLKELGVEDNTIVIFASDNGPHQEGGADPAYFNSSGGLRGLKRDLYEGGVRVPFILSWGKDKVQGKEVHTPLAFWDLYPTFAELIGYPLGNYPTDGISMLPLWEGKALPKAFENRPLYWEFHEEGGRMAIRQGNWKLVALKVDSGDPIYELYRLDQDKAEQHDLTKVYPQEVERLKALMQTMHTPSERFPFAYERGTR